MIKANFLILVIIGVFSINAALAQEQETPNELLAIYKCKSIEKPEIRLECYDNSVERFEKADNDGELVTVSKSKIQNVEREAFGFNIPSLSSINRIFGLKEKSQIRELEENDFKKGFLNVLDTLRETSNIAEDKALEIFKNIKSNPKHIIIVAEIDGNLVGGCGIFPTEGLPESTCELVKLYLAPTARGTGLGKALMLQAMAWAKENGYAQVYLETMPELSNAVTMYEKLGYTRLTKSLGNSGHDGCSIWMLKTL